MKYFKRLGDVYQLLGSGKVFEALRTACIRQHFAEHPDHFDPRQYLKPARVAIKEMVEHKLVDVLGCDGKA